MQRLEWICDGKVWSSGPYRIELVGPHLWVLSVKRRRPGEASIEASSIKATGGSLSAMRHHAEQLHRRRRIRRRAAVWASLLLVAVTTAVFSFNSAGPLANSIFLGSTSAALASSLKLIDVAAGRSWEHLHQVYQ